MITIRIHTSHLTKEEESKLFKIMQESIRKIKKEYNFYNTKTLQYGFGFKQDAI